MSYDLAPILETELEELLLARAARGQGETRIRRLAGDPALEHPHVV